MMRLFILLLLIVFVSCSTSRTVSKNDTELRSTINLKGNIPAVKIEVKNADPDEVVALAESMQEISYTYGGSSPRQGFDCSGLVNYVFGRFGVKVPRVSKYFTNAGAEVSPKNARRGDIILFTGSDINSGEVGHLGLITSNKNGELLFVHAASGTGRRVMVSGMNSWFTPRFVKIIRVF